jgi:tRNA dimethylallyltransferase
MFLREKLRTANPNSIPVLFVMGATATGKTDIAALLSEQVPAELISVDSSLVYRGMNIGTAKPDKDFLNKYPHHLVDIRNPDETYSAADFCADAQKLIVDITSRGKVPILVGGTSFYFSALEKGLPNMPNANPELRLKLTLEAEQFGWEKMHEKLRLIDPESAKRIKPTDPQRIQRALEINELSGKPVAKLDKAIPFIDNPILKVALVHSNRRYLHERIGVRFDLMIKAGLEEEIETLLARYSIDSPSFRMIGYRQVIEGKENGESLDSMVEKSIIATRQLAKRQLTWLRNQSNILWQNANAEKMPEMSNMLAEYLQDWIRFYLK